MLQSLALVLPLAAFFFLGYYFRVRLSLPVESGQILTQIIFYLTLPATVFLSFHGNVENLGNAVLMPFLAVIINLTLFFINRPFAARLKIHENARVVFSTAPLITNVMLFLSPYVYLAYGGEGLVRLSLYDAGNAFTVYMLAQPLMAMDAGGRFSYKDGLRAISRSIPMWAIVVGVMVGVMHTSIPNLLLKPLEILRDANAFLPMFTLGFFFSPDTDDLRHILLLAFNKMGLGLALGISLSFLFSDSLDRMILILAASAPLGALSLVLASLYNKDTRFASSAVSYTILIGTILLLLLDYSFRFLGLR